MASLAMKTAHDLQIDDEVNSGRSIDKQDILNSISAMLRQEEHYLCHDYLDHVSLLDDTDAATTAATTTHHHPSNVIDAAIDETCRSKMCEWIFHVIDSTLLQRETASVAMGFLDRYLSSSSERAALARLNRKEYQLAAMTCLYIAVKIREPFEMDAGLMSRLSRGIHSAEEITSLEYEILIALQWRMNGPTTFQFVNYILELLPDSAKAIAPTIYEHSHFQAELATGDYAFVPHLRQSTIAVACILNSLGGIERGSFPHNECIQFIQTISAALNVDIDSPLMNAVRGRLLESFAKSSGYELSQGVMPIPTHIVPLKDDVDALFEESPTCVSKEPLDYLA